MQIRSHIPINLIAPATPQELTEVPDVPVISIREQSAQEARCVCVESDVGIHCDAGIFILQRLFYDPVINTVRFGKENTDNNWSVCPKVCLTGTIKVDGSS
jgi:hypothetical protein